MSDTMKLVHRIAILIFILNLFFVFYIFTVPEYYQELYDWVYARDDNLQDRYVQTRHRMGILKILGEELLKTLMFLLGVFYYCFVQ